MNKRYKRVCSLLFLLAFLFVLCLAVPISAQESDEDISLVDATSAVEDSITDSTTTETESQDDQDASETPVESESATETTKDEDTSEEHADDSVLPVDNEKDEDEAKDNTAEEHHNENNTQEDEKDVQARMKEMRKEIADLLQQAQGVKSSMDEVKTKSKCPQILFEVQSRMTSQIMNLTRDLSNANALVSTLKAYQGLPVEQIDSAISKLPISASDPQVSSNPACMQGMEDLKKESAELKNLVAQRDAIIEELKKQKSNGPSTADNNNANANANTNTNNGNAMTREQYIESMIAAAKGHWKQIFGALVHIDAGHPNYIFGANKDNDIFRCEKPCQAAEGVSNWVQLKGKFKVISSNGKEVWAVDPDDNIFRCANECSDGNWKQVFGGANYIHVSAQQVWVVNKNQEIYFSNLGEKIEWFQVPGHLRSLHDAGDRVFGINIHDQLYICQKNECGAGKWKHIQGQYQTVSANDKAVYFTLPSPHSGGIIATCANPCDHPVLNLIDGGLKQLSVGPDDIIYGVNSVESIWRRDRT